MDVELRLEALEEALAQLGRSGIFNTDQGSQVTSPRFTGVLREAGTRIAMDDRGRRRDTVLIERLRRSLADEGVTLHAFGTGPELPHRAHSTLAGCTPDEACGAGGMESLAA